MFYNNTIFCLEELYIKSARRMMPLMNWYYVHGSETVGPITEEEFNELRYSGVITDETMVWQEGWSDWLPLAQVPGLGGQAADHAVAETSGLKLASRSAPMEAYAQQPVQPESAGAPGMPMHGEAADAEADLPLEFGEDAEHFVSGAKWFYWIAGLSLVNSLIAFFKGGIYFVIGLAYTQIVDAFGLVFEEDFGTVAMVVALVVNVIISGMFALVGYFSLKGIRWLMVAGIVVYVIDGLLFLLFMDWLSVAFHGYAGFCLIRGFLALNRLKKAGIALG